ncbi:MAG: ribosomal protein S27E [Oleiphilaceae bacterium]|jgi:ribosomal protein S27E
MSRERYSISIECPECGQKGTCRVSENDYPFMKKLDRSISCTDDNFETSMFNDSDAQIICKNCDHKFKW